MDRQTASRPQGQARMSRRNLVGRAGIGAVAALAGRTGHAGAMPAAMPACPDPGHARTASRIPEPAGAPGGRGDIAEIALDDERISPPEARVRRGTTIVWVNEGSGWLSVASLDGSFASKRIVPGQVFAHTFRRPGSFQYICQHQAAQVIPGRIEVA
jgi:plastocyanin